MPANIDEETINKSGPQIEISRPKIF